MSLPAGVKTPLDVKRFGFNVRNIETPRQKHSAGGWGSVSWHYLQQCAKNSVLESGCYRYSKTVKTISCPQNSLALLKDSSFSGCKTDIVEATSS